MLYFLMYATRLGKLEKYIFFEISICQSQEMRKLAYLRVIASYEKSKRFL